jgi:hypothetical protein
MNSLKTTRMYYSLDKIFKVSEKAESINRWVNKYTIDRDKYDYLIQIAKTYKFELAKDVVTALERGEVIPINTADPKDVKDKEIEIPTSISSLSFINDHKKLVTAVDISPRSSYVRNKATDEIEAFNVRDPKDFYIYMQRGYVARKLLTDKNSLEFQPNFVKAVVNSYSRMLAKSISAIYGTGAKEEWSQRLLYITICFALQNFFNYEPLKAKDFAMRFPGINKQVIMTNSKYFNSDYSDKISMCSNKMMEKIKQIDDKTIFPFDIYIMIIAKEFEEMRTGKIERRTITDRYISMYGQNSLTAIEHCESFVNMILTSEFKSGLYIDANIKNIAEDDIKVIKSCLINN